MSALVPAFAGQPLDRADPIRTDPARLAELQQHALLLRLDGLAPEVDADGRLAWMPLAEAPGEAELVFLGLLDGRARYGAVPVQGDKDPAFTHRKTWAAVAQLAPDELAIYGTARSVLDWHARHRFCAQCGQPTHSAKSGWQRDCPACGAQHFPRVDPVAIMLVECDRKLLLGRAARYPPRRYSALAGFVEPGESIGDAVAREVFEETGVRVRDVRYVASQPWPFPSQLMIGCIGFADSLELVIDRNEIEDARWFTRDDVVAAMAEAEDAPFLPAAAGDRARPPALVAGARLMKTVNVDVWSDVMCPWCAVGWTQFAKAVEGLKGEIAVDTRFMPFELNPDLAARRQGPGEASRRSLRPHARGRRRDARADAGDRRAGRVPDGLRG